MLLRRIIASGRRLPIWAIGVALASATPALAGLVDSPMPDLAPGTTASTVFYVPGVQSTNAADDVRHIDLETAFTCTSVEGQNPLWFTVQLFNYDGSGPLFTWGSPSVELNPGETRTIVSNLAAGVVEFDTLGPVVDVLGGSARIVSTSPKIICSAFLTHSVQDPQIDQPRAATANLRVVRNSQKGD